MFCNYASVTFGSSRMENLFQCTGRHSAKDDFLNYFQANAGTEPRPLDQSLEEQTEMTWLSLTFCRIDVF